MYRNIPITNTAMQKNGLVTLNYRGSYGRDRIEVGFTTTCTISAYHH